MILHLDQRASQWRPLRALNRGLDIIDKPYRAVFATEATVLLLLALMIKVAAATLTSEAFGEFMLVRSTLTLVYPLFLSGLSIAIARYTAIAEAHQDNESIHQYWSAACLMLATLLIATDLIVVLFPAQLAKLAFGSSRYEGLAVPFSVMASGFCFHVLLYSFFRGKLQIAVANGLELVNMSLPLVLIVFVHDLPSYCLYCGLGWLATFAFASRYFGLRFDPRRLKLRLVALVKYGLRRVPGDFFVVALLSLPVTFAAHIAGPAQAGMVSLSITVVIFVGYLVRPLGVVLLPRSSSASIRSDDGHFRREVLTIAAVLTAATALFVPLVAFGGGNALVLVLGDRFRPAGAFIDKMLIATWPYAVFVVARNVIDGFHEKAVNGRNAAISLCVLLPFMALGVSTRDLNDIVLGFDLALVTLGILSGHAAWQLIRRGPTKTA